MAAFIPGGSNDQLIFDKVRADKVIVFLSLSFSLTQMNNEFLI
jgi:hypothetical protein